MTEAALFSAQIGESIAQARNLAERGIEECALFTSTNVRRMVDPQLDLMYPSNIIASARADATTEELYDTDELRALYKLAEMTSDSIEECTADESYDLMDLYRKPTT